MTERERKLRRIMKAERQRQLGELVEKIVYGIPTALKWAAKGLLCFLAIGLVLCLCG
ncbi:MAG: hypothetical protein J6O13_16375 [Selenomonas sp.]|nr:hypothetical protein [Selenomonas sp.]